MAASFEERCRIKDVRITELEASIVAAVQTASDGQRVVAMTSSVSTPEIQGSSFWFVGSSPQH